MKRLIAGVGVVFVLLTGMVFVAPPAKAALSERAAERRCSVAEARLKALQANVEQARTRRTAAYQKIHERFATRIERLEAAGYNTAKLVADADMFRSHLQAYRQTADDFYASLTQLHTYACSPNVSAYSQQLILTRTHMSGLRLAAAVLRADVRDMIIPDLREARQWLQSQEGDR